MAHEIGHTKSKRRKTVHTDFGFSCDVSEKSWSDFDGQVSDAISFLERFSFELDELINKYEISDIRLDFPLHSRISENNLGQFDYIRPELIVLCARHRIGIEISNYYSSGEDEGEPVGGANGLPLRGKP